MPPAPSRDDLIGDLIYLLFGRGPTNQDWDADADLNQIRTVLARFGISQQQITDWEHEFLDLHLVSARQLRRNRDRNGEPRVRMEDVIAQGLGIPTRPWG
jgi:hypothetical protein